MYTWSGVEEDPDEQKRDWGDGDEPGRHAGDRDHHHHHHHRQRHHDDRHQHRHHNHNRKCAGRGGANIPDYNNQGHQHHFTIK